MGIEIEQSSPLNHPQTAANGHGPATAVAGKPSGNKARKVGKNAIFLVISLGMLGIANFVVLGLLSRFSGAVLAGTWAYVLSFRDPFAVFMDFGTTRLLVAEIARRREEADKLLGNGLVLGFIIGLPILLIMAVVANLAIFEHTPIIIKGIYLMGLAALIYTTSASFRSAFRAFNRFEYEAMLGVVTAVVLIIGAFIVLYFDFPFIWLFVSFVIAQSSALLWAWWTYNRQIGSLRLAYEPDVIKQLLNKTWAFTLVGLLTRAFTRIDVLILRYFQGESAAGFYALAATLFYQMNTIAQLASTAILPTMARSFVKRPDKVGQQLDVVVRLQAIVGLPITAIGIVMAPKIIHFLYGEGYGDSALVFQLLIVVIVLRFINQSLGVALTAMDKQHFRAAMLGVTVAFNIILNFVLIPQWSFWGATITAVLSEILLFFTTYLVIPVQMRGQIRWGRLIRPTFSTLALLPLLYVMRDWTLIISLPISMLAFGALLFLFRSFTATESKSIAKGINAIRFLPQPIRQTTARFILRSAQGGAVTLEKSDA